MIILGLLVEVALWLALAGAHSLRLSSSGISEAELQRRVKSGDEKAAFLERREKVLPELRALRFAGETLLQVVFVALGLLMFGYLALPLLVLPLLFVGAGAKFELIARAAHRFYERREPEFVAFAKNWRYILKFIRQDEETKPAALGHSKQDLIERLKTMRGIISKDELALIENGLSFSHKTVKRIMTPRDAIDAVDQEDALGPVTLDNLHSSGHTRFPVHNHSLDHIVGMLYLHDVANVHHGHHYVRDAMHTDVTYIRDDYTLERALAVFLHARQHLSVVVNQSQETVGLLGLEDVMEALLGRNVSEEFEYHEGVKAVAHEKSEA